MRIRSAGAAVTGTSHTRNQQPCQDAFEILIRTGGAVACVCDGAGSAARAEEGAQALAKGVSVALSREPGRCLQQAGAFDLVAGAIEKVREELARKGELADFHATLCGVLMSREGTLVFHLGDGVIFGIDPDNWEDCVVSEPENGEFAETTWFFTLADWRQRLRVFCAPPRYRCWFLMSDGAASFAARTAPWRPATNFLQPVQQYLASATSYSASQALQATLDDPRTHSITGDDKTLVWLQRDG